jgi:hypothetical protein
MFRTVTIAPTAATSGNTLFWKTATLAVELIPKPGSGKAILVERAIIQCGPGDDACATDGDLLLRYKAGTGDDCTQAIDDFLNDATSGKVMTMEAAGTEAEPQTVGFLQENLAVELYSSTNFAAAAGTNPIKVTVLYCIVDVRY